MQQVFAWANSCLKSHELCRNHWKHSSSQRQLPTRLLDVGETRHEPYIRLQATNNIPSDTPYLTLSHCWGSKRLISLTTETMSNFEKAIQISDLPSTFRDAVDFVRSCGLRYLWIDSLCIVQNSPDDWGKESSLMAAAYSHAILNLSAAGAKDGEGCLFHRSKSFKTQPCIMYASAEDKTSFSFICRPYDAWGTSIETSPLGTRGWVLQERLLSPRIIHFASDQLFWECCQGYDAEILPWSSIRSSNGHLKSLSSNIREFELDDEKLHKYWRDTVSKYSKCKLSVSSDKLPAISGLASRFCRQLKLSPTDYLAGIWRNRLPEDFIWTTNWRYGGSDSCVRVPDRAPSWSWASIDGEI
ncbi:HET-domain-containing protein, partial [Hyaloscypha variabilis F]